MQLHQRLFLIPKRTAPFLHNQSQKTSPSIAKNFNTERRKSFPSSLVRVYRISESTQCSPGAALQHSRKETAFQRTSCLISACSPVSGYQLCRSTVLYNHSHQSAESSITELTAAKWSPVGFFLQLRLQRES